MLSRAELRVQLRERRRSLSVSDQKLATRFVLKFIQRRLRRHLHIAIYWPRDGELDIRDLSLPSYQSICYLPCLNTSHPGHLYFKAWSLQQHTHLNRYGIPEPKRGCPRLAWRMDIILLPLVGFDASGHRLGMGGGYYDRSLADLARRPKNPRLIGVAHDIQEVDDLPIESWDWPLDAVITGSRWLCIHPRES
ncbi:MAG: 5-formyltetrahydrofolate cyclo-ligase [Pseudomonadales bacterium]|nr:5-formyltetrahydrofolate cyclo-ligase [Pseudomonadales bacterium]